jgi:hypothetical protein
MPVSLSNRSDIRLTSEGIPDLLPMLDRTDGCHVSSIIHDLCVRLRYFSNDDSSVLTTTWAQLGCALEDSVVSRYERHYPDRYVRPGELYLDSLYGTPDLIDTVDWAVEEIKLAWMSSNNSPHSSKFWRYWVQVKAYCKMVGTNVGRLHACHVMGDYKGGGPVYNVWEGKFTDQELADNWAMLLNHREKIK